MENFEDLYEEWIDQINQSPLVTDRITDFDEVININQQIVNNIYNIRRYLELRETPSMTPSVTPSVTRSYTRTYYSNGPYETSNIISNNTFDDQINTIFDENPIDTFFESYGSSLMNNLFDLAFNETTEYEDIKVTLSESDFDKFKKETINENNLQDYTQKECNICMDEYTTGINVTHLKCNHIFHTDCIKNWLCNEKVTCPVCRTDMR